LELCIIVSGDQFSLPDECYIFYASTFITSGLNMVYTCSAGF
jgi:hypothetical protein